MILGYKDRSRCPGSVGQTASPSMRRGIVYPGVLLYGRLCARWKKDAGKAADRAVPPAFPDRAGACRREGTAAVCRGKGCGLLPPAVPPVNGRAAETPPPYGELGWKGIGGELGGRTAFGPCRHGSGVWRGKSRLGLSQAGRCAAMPPSRRASVGARRSAGGPTRIALGELSVVARRFRAPQTGGSLPAIKAGREPHARRECHSPALARRGIRSVLPKPRRHLILSLCVRAPPSR